MKAFFAVPLALSFSLGFAFSVEAVPIKLLCKGPVTTAFDAEKLTDPARVVVEFDQAAGWVSFNGWAADAERIPATSSGTVMTFTHTSPGPVVVATTKGRIETAIRRVYLDTTMTSQNGPGQRWVTPFGIPVTTLRMTGDVPCQTP